MTQGSAPQFSVIIPACNEENFIAHAIESIQRSAQAANATYEIIVVLNRCTDRTEEIARSYNCTIVRNDEKNLSAIRNTGAQASLGQVIVTVDADSTVSKNMLRKIQDALRNPKILGGGTLIIPERWSLGIALTGLFLVPAIIFERLSGGLFFVQRETFFAIGGFNEKLLSAEDIDFARRLKRFARTQGARFITLWGTYIITSCRKFDRFGDWYFLKNPMMVLKLFKGQDRRYADIVWYDFHHINDKEDPES